MNEKQIKARRLYLVLPLLVLPFITIAFWLMDGGFLAADVAKRRGGLNTSLPNANVGKDSVKDKLSFYDQASADSAKRKEQMRNDPNLRGQLVEPIEEEIEVREIHQPKINAIRERIKLPRLSEPTITSVENYTPQHSVQSISPQVDPDLETINQTIEKLPLLQNPVKPQEKIVPEMRKEVLPVTISADEDETYFGKKTIAAERKQFLNDKATNQKKSVSFTAIVPTAQVLQTGSTIRLQLSQSLTIGSSAIPGGTMVHGVSTIENERLFVQISSIQFANTIYPVALSVFDLDGVEGIHVPGSLSRDVVKSTAEQSLQSVNVLSVDPSIKTQAITAGIGAAKNLLSRKVKAIRVTIAAGYRVLLRDNKQN
ncbi:MAG: conjugative transposon protein TraM [Sediminibacterium sp.]